MDSILYTYSLVDALFDQGEDYIDSFWHFVLCVLPEDGSGMTDSAIQKAIEDKYGLSIMIYSLGTIITRAKRKGLVRQEKKHCSLTKEGLDYVNKLETERDVSRRINELIADAKAYFKSEEDQDISEEEAEKLVLGFIQDNAGMLVLFLDAKAIASTYSGNAALSKSSEEALIRYFIAVEKSKPALFSTLRDLICGSLLSAVVQTKRLTEPSRPFAPTKVFLDTNLLFSLLGLHHDEFNIPAQELFNLMQETKRFDFCAFDFTVNEVVANLSQYKKNFNYYVPEIRVGSVYSSLRRKGWNPSRLRMFTSKIEQHLSELGIRIERTDVDVFDENLFAEDTYSILSKYKPDQGVYGQNHDLSAVNEIARIRGTQVRQMESAKAFFLTSDAKLTLYAYKERHHHKSQTISEVMHDRVFANVLWLKKPSSVKSMPLHTIIAMHSRHLFVDRVVWGKFCETLRELRDSNQITDQDIALLIYDQEVNESLRTIQPNEQAIIETKWLFDRLDIAKKNIDEQTTKELEKKETLILEQLPDVESEISNRVRHERRQQEIAVRRNAEAWAGRADGFIRFLLAAMVVYVALICSPLVVRKWSKLEPWTWLCSITLGIVVLVIPFKLKPWQGIKDQIQRSLEKLGGIEALELLEASDMEADQFKDECNE